MGLDPMPKSKDPVAKIGSYEHGIVICSSPKMGVFTLLMLPSKNPGKCESGSMAMADSPMLCLVHT